MEVGTPLFLLREGAALLTIVSFDRERVMRAYVAHQLHGVSFDSLVRHYAWDFRSFFVNVPRVRMDGVYIAVCHYV